MKLPYFAIILLFLHFLFGAADTSTNQWLRPHNDARKRVGLKPLTWDTKLAKYAQWYGNQRRFDCGLIHSTGPFGENLYWGAGHKWTPAQAVSGWISEKWSYDRRSNSCSTRDCGHYKQIVWKNTRKVGCARVVCARNAGVLFVCEYDPPGNFFGDKPY